MTTTQNNAPSVAASALPDLSSDYALTDEQIASYRRNGHVYLPGVLSPSELAAYRPVIVDAADRYNTQTLPIEERDTYGKAFLQIMNLWTQDEAVARYTLARRMGKIAADLMGVDGVRVYHDQALFKEPGGGPTPWHQDQFYWPLETNNTITLWMPLVDIPAEVGSMNFGSGSQNVGYLGDLPISDKSDEELKRFIAQKGLSTDSYGALKAGDATFHSGWTLHGAKGNPTPNMREVMTVIYFADGARIAEPKNPNQEVDLAGWFPGLKPGDLAASKLNPLVYSRK
ncbi:MAG TPA: phytanoyl-CoA dioxygenase family protein [Capsulimonadaceae bacterium]|nr:phytanoyl-CoA dioxygenase family protein [Capsulimonadaceae bacterium]